MNKNVLWIALTALVWSLSANAGELQSLRGAAALDQTNSPQSLKYPEKDKGVLERAYVQQPPLIPHTIEGYQVDLNFNKCLSCHSWTKAKEAGATKISLTHFRDRDGRELSDVSPLRYFCTQCHVPQVDAPPLVQNRFEPVKSLSDR